MEITADRVIRVITEQLSFENSGYPIAPNHSLADDLGCDSLNRVEITIALEEEFGIRIADEEFDKLTTVQQVIDHVACVCTTSEATA